MISVDSRDQASVRVAVSVRVIDRGGQNEDDGCSVGVKIEGKMMML